MPSEAFTKHRLQVGLPVLYTACSQSPHAGRQTLFAVLGDRMAHQRRKRPAWVFVQWRRGQGVQRILPTRRLERQRRVAAEGQWLRLLSLLRTVAAVRDPGAIA